MESNRLLAQMANGNAVWGTLPGAAQALAVRAAGQSGGMRMDGAPADAWDADLLPSTGERNASLQALEDSLAVREMLFAAMPDVSSAVFRVYRAVENAEGLEPELIIVGTVERDEIVAANIRSLAMRAKFIRFSLLDGRRSFGDSAVE